VFIELLCYIVDMESNYIILPDEVMPKRFRVAWAGSEFTVSFKKELQHGLTRKVAKRVKAALDERRENAIDRLADAISEYLELNPKPNEMGALVSILSAKYGIGKKTIRSAVLMLAGGINAEETK
jgi:hypothetical protein